MPQKPKNIVICLDGTGNQIEENLSNVLKLYRTLEKSEEQVVFYDQGVGTLGQRYTWGWLRQKIRNGLGLAFGRGLDDNVLQAYRFLVEQYQTHKVPGEKGRQGDKIFIFGFSRGAHTARVLAGLIYEIGILRPNQVHLSGAALTAYKQTQHSVSEESGDEEGYEGEGANFRRVAATRTAAIDFLGLWDTVSSVFIPNPKSPWPPITREKLPHTTVNPGVRAMRHAMAIDEFRRMYRVDHWAPGQVFKPNVHSTGAPDPQDAQEMWFAGCHSDVGGGYQRADSALSQFPLIWMLKEAQSVAGLKVSKRMADYVTGVKPWSKTTTYLYPNPDPTAKLHTSLAGAWWLAEVFPKANRYNDWPPRRSLFGFYLPLGEPRFIEKAAALHPSVKQRWEACADYRPVNLPL